MRVPLWLKIAYTVWLILWATLYIYFNHLRSFFWMCHIGNFVLAAALWLERPILFSWQAVSLLIAQILFTVDITAMMLFRAHVVGGTDYIFDENLPQLQRSLSFYHVIMPVLLIWALARLGYDRRAFLLQSATLWIVLPLCYWFGVPEDNVNWCRGPFGAVQTTIDPLLYLIVAMLLYPLALYLPSHIIFTLIFPRPASDAHRLVNSNESNNLPS
jgi:hypothetical protein